jgi:hypothetical protein
MKKVLLIDNEKYNVRGLVAQIFDVPLPSRTFSYKQAADIVDLQRKFKRAPEGAECVLLEKAEHTLLVKTVEEFQWAVMNEELLEILDAIVKAEEFELKEVPNVRQAPDGAA